MLSLESIPRCPHSVYAPDHGRAESCRLCFPLGYPNGDCGPVVLPRSCGTALNGHTRIKANKSNDGVCPQCGERIHFDLEDGKFECSECGTKYPSPRGISQRIKNMIAQETVFNRSNAVGV
jgi:ribosomal protein L37AE/L43A